MWYLRNSLCIPGGLLHSAARRVVEWLDCEFDHVQPEAKVQPPSTLWKFFKVIFIILNVLLVVGVIVATVSE